MRRFHRARSQVSCKAGSPELRPQSWLGHATSYRTRLLESGQLQTMISIYRALGKDYECFEAITLTRECRIIPKWNGVGALP